MGRRSVDWTTRLIFGPSLSGLTFRRVVLHSTVTFATGKVVVTETKHRLVLSRSRNGDKVYFYLDEKVPWK